MIQDWYFAAAGLLYSAVLIPSMRDPKTEIPRRSSVLTATTLSCSAVAYGTLSMWWAAMACTIGAATWTWLARYRPIREKTRPAMDLTDDELFLLAQFRHLQAQGMQKGGTVGGCGGCPSAGECGSEPV